MAKSYIKVDDFATMWHKDPEMQILHREDGPAVEWADGDKMWCIDGLCHREDGPAIEWADGEKEWWIKGRRDREDGPAIECTNGDKFWYKDGKRHREDGPAMEYADHYVEYWLNDYRLTKQQWEFSLIFLK